MVPAKRDIFYVPVTLVFGPGYAGTDSFKPYHAPPVRKPEPVVLNTSSCFDTLCCCLGWRKS